MAAPAAPDEILDVNRRYHDVAARDYDAKWGISFGEIGRHQVLGKVRKLLGAQPGPFERPRERTRLRPEQLAHLAEHLVAPDLAERDAPLGVVVARRHVVVAAVDVEDLVGSGGSGHRRGADSL